MPSGVVTSVVAVNTSVVIFSVVVPASVVIISGAVVNSVVKFVTPGVLAIVSPVVAGPSVDTTPTDVPYDVSVDWAVSVPGFTVVGEVSGMPVVPVGGIVVTGPSDVIYSFIVVDASFVGPTVVTGPSEVKYPVDLVGSD